MVLKTFTGSHVSAGCPTDAPERPLIVAPPCQSEIKRTLKARGPAIEQRVGGAFARTTTSPFDVDGECKVSGTARLWFRNGACAREPHFVPRGAINRKFTQNPISRIIGKFSPV